MPDYRKVLVSLPKDVLDEIDQCAQQENSNRSELIRQAVKEFLIAKRASLLRAQLKKGYEEMAQINLAIAEMCFEAENDTYLCYEEKLSECENS